MRGGAEGFFIITRSAEKMSFMSSWTIQDGNCVSEYDSPRLDRECDSKIR